MRITGETAVALPPAEVWAILGDPGRLARHLPGVSHFEDGGGGRWTLAHAVPLGVGDVRLRWAFDRQDERPGERARVRGTATSESLVVVLDTAFDLAAHDGGTSVRWEADVTLAGSASALARKVAGPVVRQQVDAVLRAFQSETPSAGSA